MVAEASTGDSAGGRTSVWQRLRETTDLTTYRPQLREGLVWRQFTSTQHEEYVIVQNPRAATYLRLAPEDFAMFQLMDGSRSVQELVVAYMMKYRRFALQAMMQLVEDLRYNEFLSDPPYSTFQQVRRLTRKRSVGSFFDTVLRFYLNREFPISGMDRGLQRIYDLGVWILFTPPALILLALITLTGVPLLLWHLFAAHIPLGLGVSLKSGLPILYVSLLGIAFAHELAHAFTVKSYGRIVRRSGFCMFYGFPAVFVDTQDIWMERRGARIAASWAGPYSGFILAGLAGLAITFGHGAGWVPFVRVFGLVALVENAFQLMPLIQLDGYYILMDWLDIPNLRRRALAFIRYDLWLKIRRRQRFSRDERIFTVFGLLAGIYTVYAISLALSFYWAHARAAVEKELHVPNLQSLLALVFFVVLIVPFAIGMGLRLLGTVQKLLRAAGRATGAARDRWYRERVTLLSQVPALLKLGTEPIHALAPHLKEERNAAGAAVVRQGERGDRFYLIVDGKAEVFIDERGGSKPVAELGPMDYFGERALIDDAPRAATVRAKTKLRLLSLGATDFRNTIRPYIAADARLRARIEDLAELDHFPILQPLKAREREILLSRLRPAEYAAGQVIIRQGEPGDTFFLLRSGRVEVSRRDAGGRDSVLDTLTSGDFFGEIALLLDSTRVATVRAIEETRVWTLTRQDFNDLISQYFNLDEQIAPIVRERLEEDQMVLVTSRDSSHIPAIGDAAPEFVLRSSQDAEVALSAYRGRSVLVWFSTASSANEPSLAAAALEAALPALTERGIVVIQIQASSREPAAEAPDLTVLFDPERSTYRRYGMYDHAAAQTDESVWEWQNVMRRVLREEEDGATPTAIREGIVLIGVDGTIEQIAVNEFGGAMTAILELVDAGSRQRQLAGDAAS